VGVLLYILLCGYLPFDVPVLKNADGSKDTTRTARLREVVAKSEPAKMPAQISPGARDVVARMLAKDKHARITISELLEHP